MRPAVVRVRGTCSSAIRIVRGAVGAGDRPSTIGARARTRARARVGAPPGSLPLPPSLARGPRSSLRRPDQRGDDRGHRASEGGSGSDPGGAPTRALARVRARAPIVDGRSPAPTAPRTIRIALEHVPRTRTTAGRMLHEDHSYAGPCRRLTIDAPDRAARSLSVLNAHAFNGEGLFAWFFAGRRSRRGVTGLPWRYAGGEALLRADSPRRLTRAALDPAGRAR